MNVFFAIMDKEDPVRRNKCNNDAVYSSFYWFGSKNIWLKIFYDFNVSEPKNVAKTKDDYGKYNLYWYRVRWLDELQLMMIL